MRKFQKGLSLLIALQVSMAQANTGIKKCSFESQLAPDEQTLLDGVKQALTPMSNNPACRSQVQQIQTFEQALSAYNAQASATSSGGISCMNYEGVWNSRFEDFSNNWNTPSNVDTSYSSCAGRESREAAIECAAMITSSEKNIQKRNCDAQRDGLTIAANQQLRTQTFQTGITALNDVISNPECMQSAGERRLGLIQNAVGLASQAATIAMLGTGVGLLVGGAAQLINVAIGSIFRNPTRQAMAILDNRENFNKIACLYEQIETKALRCERLVSGQRVEMLRNMFNNSAQYCDENQDVLSQAALMTNIDDIIRNLSAAPAQGENAPPAPSLTQENFEGLIDQLGREFPGGEYTRLQTAEHSAMFVGRQLELALENDDSLRAYLAERGESSEISSTQLRREARELTTKRDMAHAVHNVLQQIRTADAKGTQMTPEDLQAVQNSLKEFSAGKTSFTGSLNEVLRLRAEFGDDLGNQIAAFNTRLEEAEIHTQRLNLYRSIEKSSNSTFEDNGQFLEARRAIVPHLKRNLKRELDTLISRVRTLSQIRPGEPDLALRDTLRTQEESVIYPLLRACNQLRTVMSAENNAATREQPTVCQAFNCTNGTKTFENYLSSAGVSGVDPKRCDVNCRSHYDRFICEERGSLDAIRSRVKGEFISNGTICGKSIHEAFRNADGL